MLDECAKHLLSGDAGEPETVGGVSLPDVEGSVRGRGEVDRPPGPLTACRLVDFLTNGGEAFGRRRSVGTRRALTKRRAVGIHTVKVDLSFGRISVDRKQVDLSMRICIIEDSQRSVRSTI